MIHLSRFVTPVRKSRHTHLGCLETIAGMLLAAAALAACSSPAGDLADDPAIALLEQKILGGTVDNAHPEVMLLASRTGFLCTGTVIHVEDQTAFLLTAAHCVTDELPRGGVVPIPASQFLVVPGTDSAESTSAFSVDAVRVEQSYDGSFAQADVAIVSFSFGDGPAPRAIPALSSADDALAENAALLLVGYGQTEADDANTERRRVERSIEDLDEKLVVYTQEDGKGACFGDSGGPGLVKVAGAERVAVVISGGADSDEHCVGGLGVAMRVSGFEAFIEDVLAGDFPE
jgi:secreted trypsin-like serine protease